VYRSPYFSFFLGVYVCFLPLKKIERATQLWKCNLKAVIAVKAVKC